MIMRLYFIHGGNRVWLSAFLETAGWPFIMVVLIILYLHRRGKNGNITTPKFMYMRPRLFIAAAVIGTLTGLDDYLYAYGVARLPVSTSSLIIASQLGFTAVFAFILVKQKFTPYSINAVVLLTVGAGVLALGTSGDRPAGESNKMYVMGFVMTVAASALYGFVLPLVEMTYNKAKQEITYTLVLEIQMGIFWQNRVFEEFKMDNGCFWKVSWIMGGSPFEMANLTLNSWFAISGSKCLQVRHLGSRMYHGSPSGITNVQISAELRFAISNGESQ